MDTLSNKEHERLLLMSEHGTAPPLSPVAQKVLDAAFTPYDCEALYSLTEEQHTGIIAAAAIRAAAHHLQRCSPWTNDDGSISLDWCTSELHDIAAELENAQ